MIKKISIQDNDTENNCKEQKRQPSYPLNYLNEVRGTYCYSLMNLFSYSCSFVYF